MMSERQVSGMLRTEVTRLLEKLCQENDQIAIEIVPADTTRPPRDGEIDGEHYRFVSVDEFKRLQTEGLLLEHGTYQENPKLSNIGVSPAQSRMKCSFPTSSAWVIHDIAGADSYLDSRAISSADSVVSRQQRRRLIRLMLWYAAGATN
ncbi:hypothetical protein TELCIR_11066, partial [Teladorsagia circumcincta]